MKSLLQLIRFYNPMGSILMLYPSFAGILLGCLESGNFNLKVILLFTFGTFIMRSSGCIINDIIDRKIDILVQRTKSRPIASGEISIKSALGTLIIFLLIALIILFQLNLITIIICLSTSFLIFLYPLTKRFTNYPQLILGLIFNIGAIVGYSSMTNYVSEYIILYYLAFVVWTIFYDTIYAFQDIEDDIKIGVKSTAIRFNKSPRVFLTCVYVMFVFLLFMGGISLNFGEKYNIILVGILFYGLLMISILEVSDKRICAILFQQNGIVGMLAIFAILSEFFR